MSPALTGGFLTTGPPGKSLTVFLICIFLVTSDVEHLLMYLLPICISSLEKCPFRLFAHFLIELFVCLLLCCISSLYILDVNPLLDIWFTNIFSHFVSCLFTLLIVSFVVKKLLSLMQSHLFFILLLVL